MLATFTNPIQRLTITLLLVIGSLVAPAASWAQTAQQPGEPDISARAAIVVEYPSGRILYSKAMHDHLAPASTTKILTSILALEHGNLEDVVTISPDDLVGESTMGLEGGEQQTLHNLLYGMLLPSGNDAAMAIARYLGSQVAAPDGRSSITRFADMMNTRASQLGLTDSHFVNPHGLDADGHYSSAYDLASLTWYAFQFPVFNEIVKQPFYEAPGHPVKNTNEMLSRYPGADGVKTGWTDAGGLCLVTSASRGGRRIISVVLNAPHWYADSGAILDYGFAKLVAEPKSDNAEILSVAGRGTGRWLLADATSTPPIPAPQAMGQGGGAAPAHVAGSSAGGGSPEQTDADKFAAHIPLNVSGSSTGLLSAAVILPILLLFATAALFAWWVFPARRPAFALRFATAIGIRSPEPGDGHPKPGVNKPVLGPRSPIPQPSARTLGDLPLRGRRQPNLLVTPGDTCQAHIWRAVALADEGRQGSSMAEFILALRSGCALKVEHLDEAYELSPTGFLALYRAQAAMGMPADAKATLQYAVAAVPGDRILALTLRQFSARE